MRLLLVNPKVPPSVWSLSDVADVIGAHGMMPSLALTTLAALTPDDVDIVLHDEAEGPVDLDTECDVVGLTGYITQLDRTLELGRIRSAAARAREHRHPLRHEMVQAGHGVGGRFR